MTLELPAIRYTNDYDELRKRSHKDRLPKFDDNHLAKEKIQFTEDLADQMIKVTAPDADFDR